MVQVSCSCHTIQLALKDLKREDIYLIKKMKMIQSKISLLSRSRIQQLGISSFAQIQKQRSAKNNKDTISEN